ncbi:MULTISPECIES: DUF4331 family protein [Rhizobium]|uniref:DUF4331 domain-containing protein n=1 Tax=Rhizobium favelukesii TaxID=348824 RepID=W6S7Z5_9HYPH|nr:MULTISPECIES: DUF4331 family protein [Rhizobium]MCA0801348.1 DUF4331 domain-containing protein [Rhizobium sp. T1473]MCS0457818.1 DUF4331 domain-containing protein [Rhizobium favelukesii]UFS80464.1 DUF4331 domain-containing protein [Rhizobium sp. T136]CDM62306.1 hypothetical protein LPU83_pLPU83d_0936 [Rhizobium favelukesii]
MSDHFSGPAVMDDPAVDITDFYAFPSPERPGNLVLIMNAFPMATSQSFFSDVVTYRFRLRPLTQSGAGFVHGPEDYTIDVRFSDVPDGTSAQKGSIVTSDGRETGFVTGEPSELEGMRIYAGLVSDPFFMDVEATIRTDISGKLSFGAKGTNTVEFRDVLTIVVEVPFAPILEGLDGVTLIGAIAETLVARSKPIRLERVGRPEIKNVMLSNATRDPKGVELRDLYNKEDAFSLSREYRPLYESRVDATLAFFDGLDGEMAWQLAADGRHPMRDLLMDDYLVLDLAHPFATGNFLEIERAALENRPHASAGGRWLDDDILDEMLTLLVNGGRGERLGDGVDGPTNPAAPIFPYVRQANERTDLSMPAFVEK